MKDVYNCSHCCCDNLLYEKDDRSLFTNDSGIWYDTIIVASLVKQC